MSEDYILNTKCGQIKPVIKDNILIFRSIPYAQTPRFQSPIPITHWDGVFDATQDEVDCPQLIAYQEDHDSFYAKEFHSDKGYRFSEDYVTLNLITRKEAKKLPVLLFIHGGGFNVGSVGELPYGQSIEYIKRDVILVNISYRVNIFGFYRSDNYGLMDMEAAIDWIRINIEDYGGDPDAITLMGQSAGAMSIVDLLYTKRLDGKIKGAVFMSGAGAIPSILGPYTKQQSASWWDQVRQNTGVTTKEEFQKLNAKTLWQAWKKQQDEHFSYHTYTPGIDGLYIPDKPEKLLKSHQGLDIPIIVGVTAQDYLGPFMYLLGRQYLKWHLKDKQSTCYGYFFDHDLPGNSYKSFHCADLWYMMGNLDQSWRPFGKDDEELKDNMVDYIANFVKSQDPNSNNLKPWPAYTKNKHLFKRFDTQGKDLISFFPALLKTLYFYLFEKGPM